MTEIHDNEIEFNGVPVKYKWLVKETLYFKNREANMYIIRTNDELEPEWYFSADRWEFFVMDGEWYCMAYKGNE